MKKTLSIISLMLSLLFLLPSCGEKAPETPEKEFEETDFKYTEENYPKMGGSLACLPLGEAVTATMLNISREEADSLIRFEGSTTDNYKWLLDGTFDIILAYEPSEEAWELINSDETGVEMTPIGADALVFIGSKNNPVNNLTYEDIKGIYSGKTTSWAELGGNAEDVVPFQRNKDSGSQTLFDKLINLGDDLMSPPSEYFVGSMIGLLEAVADYNGSNGALGYTVYYYLTNMEAGTLESTKIFDYEGVTPSNETISSGEYKLTNDFYVVIRKDAAEDSPERLLYNWLTSPKGKELIERENYAAK